MKVHYKKKKPASPKGRSARRVPLGRTLSTYDHYLGRCKTPSRKERPVVVIETNRRNELAVVPLSSRAGKFRTQLKNYQQGQSYFKHFVEIEDDEGLPIKVNKKFRENHRNQDVSNKDIEKIKDKVFNHSSPKSVNREKLKNFVENKKSPRLNHSGQCRHFTGGCKQCFVLTYNVLYHKKIKKSTLK